MSFRIDISGKRYGNLLVESFTNGKWVCQCDCGNTTQATVSDLRRGNRKSCGCAKVGNTRSRKDIAGHTYGMLEVLKLVRTEGNESFYQCKCECGNICIKKRRLIVDGTTSSCGCLKTPHNMARSAEYVTWASMKQRCINPSSSVYEYYGGDGVTICERWLESFENFYEDMGNKPKGYALDKDKYAMPNQQKIYSKETCCWITKGENSFIANHPELYPIKRKDPDPYILHIVDKQTEYYD